MLFCYDSQWRLTPHFTHPVWFSTHLHTNAHSSTLWWEKENASKQSTLCLFQHWDFIGCSLWNVPIKEIYILQKWSLIPKYWVWHKHLKITLSKNCSQKAKGGRTRLQCSRGRFNLWTGRSPGEENGNPLQYSYLENPTDRGAWRATVHGSRRVEHNWVTKQQQMQQQLLSMLLDIKAHSILGLRGVVFLVGTLAISLCKPTLPNYKWKLLSFQFFKLYYVSNQIKSISLTACELLRCGLGCRVSTIAIDFKKLMIWPRTQGFLFSKRGFSLYMSNLKKMRDQNKIFQKKKWPSLVLGVGGGDGWSGKVTIG